MAAMRLLVVDDEVALVDALRRGLKEEGFSVDTAHRGDEGLWMASEQSYDAIILDLMLPGLNGYKVCRRLRELGNWTPILMLTAKDGDLDEAEGLDTGADDFLAKPFAYVVLLARLHALLRRSQGGPPGLVLRAGDLLLDPVSHRCSRKGGEIELTAKEFTLLEFLMRRPDEAVSRRQILDNVWDSAFDGDPNIVEVYVGYLRRKVDSPFGRSAIQTVRGVGYRLDGTGG